MFYTDAFAKIHAVPRFQLRLRAALAAVLLLAATLPARADLAAIHRDKLPQTASVLSALDDATELEPYTDHWSSTWDYPVTKPAAAARLGTDLSVLRTAVKKSPENEELLLLTALVAHYAYNVDAGNAEDTYRTVRESIVAAAALNPSDIRPNWFRANFLCQTDDPVPGAATFLSIEAAHPWRDLPAAFWDNYLACALITQMPAHALRAVDHLKALNAAPSGLRDDYASMARKRFDPVDLSKTYDDRQAWYAVPTGSEVEVTSTACGLRFRVKGDWKIERVDLQKGVCTAVFGTGPYSAPKGPLSPEILVIVRQPDGQETITDFLHRFTIKGTFSPMVISTCPAAACLAMKGLQPGGYGKDGDSLPRLVLFAANDPPFPGLAFETPQGPPTASKNGVHYYRPDQTLERMPGTLYYLVGLDTASSIGPQAAADFDWFLQHVQAEGAGPQ